MSASGASTAGPMHTASSKKYSARASARAKLCVYRLILSRDHKARQRDGGISAALARFDLVVRKASRSAAISARITGCWVDAFAGIAVTDTASRPAHPTT